jgi:polysaccharide deacetylase family protein (PEP-CTERM system associated)
MLTNALSLDLEEWYHPELVREHLGTTPPSHRAGAVVKVLLEQLDRHGHRCTFFLLSDTLCAYPDLVRELVERGHEIGMHGHTHRMLTDHTPESFEAEVQEFLNLLEEHRIGVRPKGYRAPTFSLEQGTSWALDILGRHGFLYDSSIFPLRNGVYGVAGAPLDVYRPDPQDVTKSRTTGIVEFPMSVARIGPAKIPVSGGFYFRCLPFGISRWLMRSINAQSRPFVFYFHPWELDPGIPRVRLNPVSSFITYWGISSMQDKIERLFSSFRFARIDEVLQV